MSIRAALVGFIVALAVTATLGFSPAARSAETGTTWMVGDSLTTEGTSELRYYRPTWEIDARNGRPVGDLKVLIAERFSLAKVLASGAPSTVVIALGTNATLGWSLDDYREAVRRIPLRTTVVLVTTYRDGQAFSLDGLYSQRPRIQSHYSSWMRQIAEERPRTCLVEWRRRVLRDPTLLRDGTHATGRGQRVWASMVANTTRECQAG